MRCPRCGIETNNNTMYCPRCGLQLNNVPYPQNSVIGQNQTPINSNRTAEKLSVVSLIMAMINVGCLIAVGILYVFQSAINASSYHQNINSSLSIEWLLFELLAVFGAGVSITMLLAFIFSIISLKKKTNKKKLSITALIISITEMSFMVAGVIILLTGMVIYGMNM